VPATARGVAHRYPPVPGGPSVASPSTETTSTLADDDGTAASKRSHFLRNVFLVLLALFLLAGVAGVFGLRSTTAAAERDGYRLEVKYARVTRAGLASPFAVAVHRDGGFTGDVEIVTTSNYFDLFSQTQPSPQPDSESGNADTTTWHFDKPDGATLSVSAGGSIQSDRHTGASGTTSVVVDGRTVVKVRYRTRVVP
jgi:hypothetical protein